jgi:hypothetical protein
MSSPADDDPLPLGGVWVGPEPPPARPPKRAGPRPLWVGTILGFCLFIAGFFFEPTTGQPLQGLGTFLVLAGICLDPHGSAPPAAPPKPPPRVDPLPVVYAEFTPLVTVDRVRDPLEEQLLTMCGQDAALLERLLGHERDRHPHLSRSDLVRLAIDHFRRDRS